MSEANPTAERREEIVGELAEWLHAAAREAKQRLLQADTTDEFVKLAASLTKLARGVRQCVMVHDRLEGRRLSAEAAAQDERVEAEFDARRNAVERHKARISGPVEERFEEEWPETEDLEDNDVFNGRLDHLTHRLDDLAEREDFLDLDPDTLIAQLCEEFGIAPPPPRAATTSPDAAAPDVAALTERAEGAGPAHGGPAVHAPNTS